MKIQCSRLGSMGRFGNAIFQKAFTEIYAKRHGLEAEMPPWVGSYLFDHQHKPLSCQLVPAFERPKKDDTPELPLFDEFVNRDFVGWGQHHTAWYSQDRTFFRSLFQPKEKILSRCNQAMDKLAGTFNIGIHLRRGDYGRSYFYITPVEWYLKKLQEIWGDYPKPRLFIATEDPALAEEFREFEPKTIADLTELNRAFMPNYNYLPLDTVRGDPWQLDFYPEFYILSKCDMLLIPNSTFSFAAAMLNTNCRTVYRSNMLKQCFEEINPWDAYPLTRDKVEDHPEIPGVALKTNPYWAL